MATNKLSDIFAAGSWSIPARVVQPELLDQGIGTAEDVKANFADLRRINRYLGGVQAITHHLYPRLLAHAGTTTLVDLGVGSGDIDQVIRRWAQQHQLDVQVWGVDLSARNLMLTRHADDKLFDTRVQADALHLPFKAASVDYFISSLFLHHLSPDQIKKLLAETFQSARKGIIMSDLTRGWLPQIAFKLGQPIFARNFLTQHDGIASIRRAYTPDELLHLAQTAGLSDVRVHRHFGWRMTLVAEK